VGYVVVIVKDCLFLLIEGRVICNGKNIVFLYHYVDGRILDLYLCQSGTAIILYYALKRIDKV